jgi:hypothetical protein
VRAAHGEREALDGGVAGRDAEGLARVRSGLVQQAELLLGRCHAEKRLCRRSDGMRAARASERIPVAAAPRVRRRRIQEARRSQRGVVSRRRLRLVVQPRRGIELAGPKRRVAILFEIHGR